MKNIRFLNFRICRDLQHCGRSVFEKIKKRGTVCNTVICSPPGLGKTTLLRSLVQCCSDELCGTSVVVIDERNEISGSFQGIPQINLGMRTDVLSGVDKAGGILRAVRSMGPKIIAVDELGGEEDLQAIRWAMQSGVRILATIHSDCIQQTKSKLGQVLAEQFQCYVVISERGKYECYYD
jgi:stage III sporulation protein AA